MKKLYAFLALLVALVCLADLVIGFMDKSLGLSQCAFLAVMSCLFLAASIRTFLKIRSAGLPVVKIHQKYKKEPEEQAVLIHFKLSDEAFGSEEERQKYLDLGDLLEGLIQKAGAGTYDGDEFGGGECTLFFYGANADDLFSALKPTLQNSPLSKGARVVKQYGYEGGHGPRDMEFKL